MPLILTVNGRSPQIDDTCFVAENATITGDVIMGKSSSVWFQAVIRGDVNKIIIGEEVNIQDGAVVHGSYGGGDTVIGDRVSIGHKAIVHGCTVQDDVLIGMGAIVLDDAVLQSGCVIAAGAVVTKGTICETGWIYAGTPAKKIKELSKEQADQVIGMTAKGYTVFSKLYDQS